MSEDKICSISGCRKPSKRSMKRDRISESVTKSNLKVKDARSRTILLCADHWKTVKKVFKKDTKGERLRWGLKKDTKSERLRWGH
ncbi:MAG: hypothetical protein KGD60_01755 [Candidatus Thorarchaeota archaeon]|nr:hypothetical protein [Candidatus Thorarchaeota archaeon]